MLQSLLVCNIAMGNLCNSGPKSDPDSAWKQQNKESKENPMYIFADLAKGGCLVEAYKSVLETEGVEQAEEEVRKIVRTEFPVCLYEGGKGKTVTRADYIRWKYEVAARRNHAYMDENITDQTLLQEYKDDRFNKVEDHPACWRMDKRGGVGETPLHLIFLMDSFIHNQVGYVLLDMYPRLALDFYEGDEYFGESCLHIAIVYGNFELVKRLVECGAEINRRATGQFFLPEDQKRGKIKKQTNYKGYAYYGEYPLAFACSFGNRVIYDYLLDHGADPDLQDSFGNTVLHMAVIADQPEMYKYAYQHHKKPAKPAVKNEAKLTPLTLASKLGRHRIFQEMLELSSIETWRFSNIMCSVYPLAPLDTISPTGDTNWESALWFIINGETDGHLDMLEGGVVRHLLDDKWKTFAQMRFYKRLVLALFHLLMVSLSVYLRPADNLLQYRGAKDVVRYTAEVITVISCARNVVMSLFEVHSQGFLGFLKNCKHAPAKTLFLVSCVVMLMCVPCRLLSLTLNPASCQEVEDTLLILAVPCAWIFLLFFARSVKLTGPFVTMIYKMCTGDLFRFAIIYTIFLCGFTQGFYFLFRDIDDQTITSFSSLSTTIMTLIQMTLGEFRYEEFDNTHYSFLTKLVFGVFMVIVPILLLNMLIAMMGNTYQQVISKSEKEWRRQWAKIVIVLERAYSKEDLRRFQDRYSIKMGVPANEEDKGDDCEHEGHHRGLMVIKACNKTKARQRKGAVNNWKRFGREVMRQLKQQKKDGNDGPLELKTRRRRPKGRSISRDQKDSFDRPSSVESGNIAQNLLSAVDQLAWERKLDYSHGQSLERHVSEMKIPVYYGEDDVPDAGNTRADSKPPVNRRPRREHRPHRNQVEPLRQGSAESSNRSANQTPLLSLPSETSLEFAIGPDGDSSPFGVKNLKPLASSEHDDMPVRIQDDDWFDKIESPRSARRSTSPKGSPQRKPQSSYVTKDLQQDGGSLGEQSRQESPDSKRGSPHRKHRHRHHKHKSHRHKGDSPPPERESTPQEGDSPDLNKESPSHQGKSHGHKEESPQRVEESSPSVEESPQYGDSSIHDKKTSRHRKRKKEKSSKAASQASLNSVSSQTSLLNAQAEMAGQTNESSV